MSEGLNINNLSSKKLLEFTVPVPTLQQQRRIVAILDEAFAAINQCVAATEARQSACTALFLSALERTFARVAEENRRIPVAEIADHRLGKMLDRNKNRGRLRPYLRNQNVRWFEFDLEDVLEMRFEEAETERYLVRKGDVVICEGGYPGRAAIWENEEPFFFQKALHRVRFADPLLAEWFLYYLFVEEQSGRLKRHFTGTGISHFTGKALGRFEFPVPPEATLSSKVPRFRHLRQAVAEADAIAAEKLAALTALKQSILHKAFTGELTSKTADKLVEV